MNRKMMTKKGAVLILSLILILSVVFILKSFSSKKHMELRLIAVVYGKEEINIPLKANMQEQDYTLSNNMVVTVKGESVWIKKSDCKNQVCVHSGILCKAGDIAVCVPNKTIIEIKGDSALVDAKTG
ncbi:MAG: NusG domain II-containing protein [Candidatus Fimenecus sp.]